MLDAKVIPWSGAEIHYSNCLVVNSHRDPPDGPTVLATVDHFVKQENQGGFPWKILPVTEEPTSFRAAMDLAAKYAREQNVPVILVNPDGLSSDAEKQQTDTVILQKKP
jgi:hypothetical protein